MVVTPLLSTWTTVGGIGSHWWPEQDTVPFVVKDAGPSDRMETAAVFPWLVVVVVVVILVLREESFNAAVPTIPTAATVHPVTATAVLLATAPPTKAVAPRAINGGIN